MNCEAGTPVGVLEETVSSGDVVGLQYDPQTTLYSYAWKIRGSGEGTCREFVLKLVDTTSHAATFALR